MMIPGGDGWDDTTMANREIIGFTDTEKRGEAYRKGRMVIWRVYCVYIYIYISRCGEGGVIN